MRSLLGGVAELVRRPRNDAPIPYTGNRSGMIGQAMVAAGSVEAQLRSMGSVGTLFQIVHLLSTSTAEVGWHLYRTSPSGLPEDRVEVTRHAALDVWNRPNPFMTRQELVEVTQQHLDLTGEAWWVVARGAGRLPLELWPVRPDRMSPVPDPEAYLSGYEYAAPGGERIPLGLDEVIFLRMPNPSDPYRGLGPVQSLLTHLDGVKYTAEWNRNFFANSAEPGGIIQVDKRLSDDEFAEMTTRWGEQHRGVANAHRVAVIEQGTWIDRKYTQRDMQFVELQAVGREVIREAFGLHVQFLGGSDVGHSRAEAEAAEVILARWKIKPRLGRIAGALAELLKLYGPTGSGLEFGFDSPVPPDLAAENERLTSRTAAWKTLVDGGCDPQAALTVVGLPDVPVRAGLSPRELADMVQSIYLGVDSCLTWDEARDILNRAGADLGSVPQPVPAPALVPAARLDQPLALAGRPRNDTDPPDLPPSELPDVQPLQEDWETALAALLAVWADLSDGQKSMLVVDIRRIAEGGSLADLTRITVDTGPAAAELAEAMRQIARAAADRLVAEAAAQGVTVAARVPSGLDLVAGVVADQLGTGLRLSATAAAMRANGPAATAEEVGDAVAEALDALTDAEPARQLGSALTGAQNAARVETLAGSTTVGAIYATEVNDSSTCLACAQIDGKWLGNTDDLAGVLRAYPGGAYGGYVGCLGRERCRGSITGVWR